MLETRCYFLSLILALAIGEFRLYADGLYQGFGKFGLKHTRRGSSTDAPHLRLHFTLTEIGDDTANFIIDEDVDGLPVA